MMRKGPIKGKALRYNAAICDRYRKSIVKLVDKMCKTVERELLPLYRQLEPAAAMDAASLPSQARIKIASLDTTFTSLFSSSAKTIAARMVGDTDKDSGRDVVSSLKDTPLSLSVKDLSKASKDIITASIEENVALIKSIQSKYFGDVKQTVMRSILEPDADSTSLAQNLQKMYDLTKKRAEFIAGDQTRKVYSTLAREKMAGAGVKKFEWMHSSAGKHPREMHVELNGQVFRFDRPPVIDEDGTRGFPGQLINCRCTQIPVIDFGDNDAAA